MGPKELADMWMRHPRDDLSSQIIAVVTGRWLVVSLSFATTTMAGLERWELFVHVLGDSPPSMHTFPIKVTTSDTVGNLRCRVFEKKHCRFKGIIDEDDLILWKVLPPFLLLYNVLKSFLIIS
jgi:Crinkler effector protein N-terminal domain